VTIGWILAGGRSSRYGSPKAVATLEGEYLARRVADAMRVAGAREVRLVGAEDAVARRLGLPTTDDDDPGAGPLGGVRTALRCSDEDRAWIAPCDVPAVTAATWRALDAALATGEPIAVAEDAGDVAWLVLAARVGDARARVETSWLAGERTPHRAWSWATRVPRPADELHNVNRPEDLPGRP